jgi:hypothetical protein
MSLRSENCPNGLWPSDPQSFGNCIGLVLNRSRKAGISTLAAQQRQAALG